MASLYTRMCFYVVFGMNIKVFVVLVEKSWMFLRHSGPYHCLPSMKTCHPQGQSLSILVCPTFHHTIVVAIALVSVSFSYPHLVVSVVSVEEKVEKFLGLYLCVASIC